MQLVSYTESLEIDPVKVRLLQHCVPHCQTCVWDDYNIIIYFVLWYSHFGIQSTLLTCI